MIQSGIGEGELAGGCFITSSMFQIEDVGTISCSMAFWTNRIAGTVRRSGGCACYSRYNRLRPCGFGLYHRYAASARLLTKEAKRPGYRRSLSNLRSINDSQEQRAFDLPQPFCCTSDYALKGQSILTRLKNDTFGNATNPN